MAGGAALVGLAGGLALTRGKQRKGVLSRIPTPKLSTPNVKLPKIDRPEIKPDKALKAIGSAAGEVAQRSERVGQVAAEVQKASEALGKRAK